MREESENLPFSANLMVTFMKVIHWLFPFLTHFKNWRNVRSRGQVNLSQPGMVFRIPMMSKATNLYQEIVFCGPSSAASCKDLTNRLHILE